MSNTCEICQKKRVVGGSIVRKGLSKKSGGIGLHVVKNTKRVFKPNIQKIRVKIGTSVKRMKVCTACIRSEKIQKV